MAYLITLNPESKSIRGGDNLHLGLATRNGVMDAYLIKNGYHDTNSLLIGMPLTINNSEILGVSSCPKLLDLIQNKKDWIVPPFKIQPWVLRKGGPFTRLRKYPKDKIEFDSEHTATLFSSEKFDPATQSFIPSGSEKAGSIDLSNRESWPIKIHASGSAVREPNKTERLYPIVPWTDYALGHLDLWIEQFRCWCLNLPIPSEVRDADD